MARRKRPARDLRSYRGYTYERVTAARLRLYRPGGEFLCYLGPRDLVREIRLDKLRCRRMPFTVTLPLFQEAA